MAAGAWARFAAEYPMSPHRAARAARPKCQNWRRRPHAAAPPFLQAERVASEKRGAVALEVRRADRYAGRRQSRPPHLANDFKRPSQRRKPGPSFGGRGPVSRALTNFEGKAERRRLLGLAIEAVPREHGDPELTRLIAILSGVDTEVIVRRAYPSAREPVATGATRA